MARSRLTPGARREQLLDIGARLFAAQPYEGVHMDALGAQAGVSRALVYRYFPSKRDLFAAIYQRAADRLLATVGFAPDGAMDGWVAAGLDAHIDYFLANEHTVLAANRELAGDPVIQGIISAELGVLRERMIEATELAGRQREIASAALLAWLSFVRTICVEWLQHKTISRAELREVCLHALQGALSPVTGTGTG